MTNYMFFFIFIKTIVHSLAMNCMLQYVVRCFKPTLGVQIHQDLDIEVIYLPFSLRIVKCFSQKKDTVVKSLRCVIGIMS